jgi:hypothetical protein
MADRHDDATINGVAPSSILNIHNLMRSRCGSHRDWELR